MCMSISSRAVGASAVHWSGRRACAVSMSGSPVSGVVVLVDKWSQSVFVICVSGGVCVCIIWYCGCVGSSSYAISACVLSSHVCGLAVYSS